MKKILIFIFIMLVVANIMFAQSIEQFNLSVKENSIVPIYDSDANGNRYGIKYKELRDTLVGNNLSYNLGGLHNLRAIVGKTRYTSNYVGNILVLGDSEIANPDVFVAHLKNKFDNEFGEAYGGYCSVDYNALEGLVPNSWGGAVVDHHDYNGIDGSTVKINTVSDSFGLFMNYAFKQSRPDRLIFFYKTSPTGGSFSYKIRRDNTPVLTHSGTISTTGAVGVGVLVMDGLDTTGSYGHQQFIVNSNGDGDIIGLGYQATTNVKSSIIINKAGRGGWSAETYWKDIIKDTIALKQIESINPKLLCFYLGSNDTNYPDSTQYKDLDTMINIIHTKLPYCSILLITPSDVVATSEIVSTIEQLEKKQRILCDKYREFVSQVSIRRILGDIDSATQNGLVGDGVHDSILGGKIAADWIYSEIIKH